MSFRPVAVLVLALAFVGLVACRRSETGAPASVPQPATKAPASLIIGLSMADLKDERWQRDHDLFIAYAESLGATVLDRDANGDPQVQIEQCKNLLMKGVQVLVVVPKNADAAAPIIQDAHDAKVKVLCYDRLITGAAPDVYVSFNNYRVGEIQAQAILAKAPRGKYLLIGGDPGDKNANMLRDGQMKVLRSAVEEGRIEIVASPFCDKWLRSEATRYTEETLARHPDLVAIVASNDNTAGGAIAVLKAHGLDGKVAVSGQDADLEGCRNVVAGTQTITVYKPIRKIAEACAEVAISLARGDDVDVALAAINDGVRMRINNGTVEVPTIFLPPIAVAAGDMEATVVADGFHTHDEVYGQ